MNAPIKYNNVTSQPISALDKLFQETSKEEMDKIVNEVLAMNFSGPTISEYMNGFDSHYSDIYGDTSLFFNGYNIELMNIEKLMTHASINNRPIIRWRQGEEPLILEKDLTPTYHRGLLFNFAL